MNVRTSLIAALIGATSLCAVVQAQPAQQGAAAPQGQAAQAPVDASQVQFSRLEPNITIGALLANARQSAGKDFLLDPRVRPSYYVGDIDAATITYPVLLGILRSYGYAAVEIEGRINIVPDDMARQLPTRIVTPNQRGVPDDELVTMILEPANLMAAQIIPILRPMLPQYAHMAAMVETNKLIIVDRFANAKRIAAVIAELDK